MIQFDQELNKYKESLSKADVEKMVKEEGTEATSFQQNKINQIVKRYNLAINYCQTNSYDLAYIQIQKVARLLPNDVKVQLLSALICMHEGKDALAAQALEQALKLDPNNQDAQTYKAELSAVPAASEEETADQKASEKRENKASVSEKKPVKKAKPVKSTVSERPKQEQPRKVVANGSDYEEVTSNKKSFIYLGIGFLIGVIAVCILVIPTVRTTMKNQYASESASYDDQLKAKETEISSLKAELEASQADTKAAQKEVKTYKSGNKALLDAAQEYVNGNTTSAAEKLMEIDTKILTTKASKNLYNAIKEKTYASSAKNFYNNGLNQWYKKNYSEAESYFLKAIKADDSNSDYYYYLARAYEADGKTNKAIKYYNKVVDMNSKHVSDSKSRITKLEASTETTTEETTTEEATTEAN
jgi:Tfp pilus assembly protein PilF